jgi:hypothetical protein
LTKKEPTPRDQLSPKQRRLVDLALWLGLFGLIDFIGAGLLYAFRVDGPWLVVALILMGIVVVAMSLTGWALTRTGPPFEDMPWWWPWTRRWKR